MIYRATDVESKWSTVRREESYEVFFFSWQNWGNSFGLSRAWVWAPWRAYKGKQFFLSFGELWKMNDGLERDDVYYRLVIVKFIDEIFKNFIEQLFAGIIDCSCTYNNM